MFSDIITNEQLFDLAILSIDLDIQLLVSLIEMLLKLFSRVLMQRHDMLKRLELVERTPVQVLEQHRLAESWFTVRFRASIAMTTSADFEIEIALHLRRSLTLFARNEQRLDDLIVGDSRFELASLSR